MKIKDFDMCFTNRKKGFFALGAVVFALLWMFLWDMFPMQWHALFYSSAVGSNITLVLLATVLILPMCWIFSVITSRNISVTKNYIVNLVFMVAVTFLFSLFRYSAVYIVVIAVVLHVAAMAWVIFTAVPNEKKHIKRIKDVKYEKITGETVTANEGDGVITKKKQLIISSMWAVVYVLLINTANILLFWKMAFLFND